MKRNSFAKKLVAVLVAAVMCVPCFAVMANAEDTTAGFTLVGATVAPGDTIDIPVAIYDNPGICGIEMSISFDSSKLAPISAQAGLALGSTGIYSNLDSGAGVGSSALNSVKISFFKATNVTSKGVFFVVSFLVKETATAGSTALTATSISACNQSGADIAISSATCNINISADKAPDAETDKTGANIRLKANASTMRYMDGFTDGTFRPNEYATRYQVVEAFYKLFSIDVKVVDTRFKDVDGAHNAMVKLLVSAGVLDGYPDNTFRGTKNITRAEFCKIICCLLDLDTETVRNAGFTDVAAKHWAKNYINACAKAGLVEGKGDKRFAPDANITRAEVVTVINRITGAKPGTASSFSDVSRDAWYFGAVAAAAK